MNTAKVQLRIPPALHEWIVQWAKENHRSMNAQILMALDEIRRSQTKTAPQQQALSEELVGATTFREK